MRYTPKLQLLTTEFPIPKFNWMYSRAVVFA